eukprot:TRINITY_DN19031_c0_g1_i1.p1 TRINITY_DN19031_c0_g1~~TRINITY_DN19031_c0_g1_i1.p1  ORF type:complete len:612 (-),score=122.60 TRINITY_DN19031_c0_g1_i1:1169-3004(-)
MVPTRSSQLPENMEEASETDRHSERTSTLVDSFELHLHHTPASSQTLSPHKIAPAAVLAVLALGSVISFIVLLSISFPLSPRALQNQQFAVPHIQNTVPITLEIKYAIVDPDGVPKRAMTVNGTIPGPQIDVEQGQVLQIKIINSLDVPTAMHWHGLMQKGSAHADGPAGVTQCPIPPGEEMVYLFSVNQTGTAWYHSHFGVQYGEGVHGAIIMHPKSRETYSYDEERVLVLQDWYHNYSDDVAAFYLSSQSGGIAPIPDSGLINGRGIFNCSWAFDKTCKQRDFKELFHTTLVVGRTYRFRLIGAMSYATYLFSIDQHNLLVIELDGADVQKTPMQLVEVNPGQRVSVLVTPRVAGSFWIRARMDESIFEYSNEALDIMTLGIINVQSDDELVQNIEDSSAPNSTSSVFPTPHDIIGSFYEIELDLEPLEYINVSEPDFVLPLTFEFNYNALGVNLPVINKSTLVLPETPILYSVIDKPGFKFSPENNVYHIPGQGKMVELILVNHGGGSHPFHLHGHMFWVLARGIGHYRTGAVRLKTNNPVLRDTIRVPGQGYAVLRFVADNPGVWFMHCHMEWHLAAGMGVILVEDAPTLAKFVRIPKSHKDLCSKK